MFGIWTRRYFREKRFRWMIFRPPATSNDVYYTNDDVVRRRSRVRRRGVGVATPFPRTTEYFSSFQYAAWRRSRVIVTQNAGFIPPSYFRHRFYDSAIFFYASTWFFSFILFSIVPPGLKHLFAFFCGAFTFNALVNVNVSQPKKS